MGNRHAIFGFTCCFLKYFLYQLQEKQKVILNHFTCCQKYNFRRLIVSATHAKTSSIPTACLALVLSLVFFVSVSVLAKWKRMIFYLIFYIIQYIFIHMWKVFLFVFTTLVSWLLFTHASCLWNEFHSTSSPSSLGRDCCCIYKMCGNELGFAEEKVASNGLIQRKILPETIP